MALEKYEFRGQQFDLSSILELGIAIITFTLLPLLLSPFSASSIVILAIVALGYNLLLGYGGELSFGHAAFYGGGAYLTALWAEIIPNLYIDIILATICVGIISAIFGAISLRRRGLYFAMITLALAQMVYTTVYQTTAITGGANGLILPIGPGEAALGPLQPLNSKWDYYLIGLVVLAVIYFAIYRVTRSPFGRALMAIRESEERARHLGYPINRMLLVAFTMSGLLAGLAGAMHAALFAFIGPSLLFWTMSGEIVLLTILGGIGTRNGPIVGAVVFGILSEELSSLTNNWPIILGAIFIVIVMLAPQGLYGLYKQYLNDDERPGEDIQKVLVRIWRG